MPSSKSNKSPDDRKLKELILFISRRSERDPNFGATKLNKLLFFADFLAYAKLGHSITGQDYQKLPNGPAPRRLVPITKEMSGKSDSSFAWAERQRYGRLQKVPVALREPNLDGFSAAEIAIVTDVIETLAERNAKEVSTLSHEFDGWKLAEQGETIPYETALVKFAKPRRSDVNQAFGIGDMLAEMRRECLAIDG
jgi:hypothetical protein